MLEMALLISLSKLETQPGFQAKVEAKHFFKTMQTTISALSLEKIQDEAESVRPSHFR